MRAVRILAVLALLAAFTAALAPPATAATSLAPDFEISLSDGSRFNLSANRGKVILLDFMYPYCPSCAIAEGALKDLYAKYRRDPDTADRFEILSINVLPAYNLNYLAQYRVDRDFDWLIGNDNFGADKVQTAYVVTDLVHLFVVDPQGRLTLSYVAGIGLSPEGIFAKVDPVIADSFAGTAPPITLEAVGIYVLISLAAVASFFSPCSFPLLPGYMMHYLRMHSARGGTRAQAALGGVVSGLGIILVYGIIGAVVILAGAAAGRLIPFLPPIVGGVLIALGLLTLTSRQFYWLSEQVDKLRAKLFGEGESSDRFYLSLFSYGAGYGAAGFGCVAAPFIAAVLYATTVGGPGAGALAFLLYAVIVIALMVAITLALAAVGDAAVKKMSAYTEVIKKVSAVALIVVGAYLLWFWYSGVAATR